MSKPFVNWDELAWVYNLISEVHKNVETRKKIILKQLKHLTRMKIARMTIASC